MGTQKLLDALVFKFLWKLKGLTLPESRFTKAILVKNALPDLWSITKANNDEFLQQDLERFSTKLVDLLTEKGLIKGAKTTKSGDDYLNGQVDIDFSEIEPDFLRIIRASRCYFEIGEKRETFRADYFAVFLKTFFYFKTWDDDLYFFQNGVYRKKAELLVRNALEVFHPECTEHLKKEVLGHIKDTTTSTPDSDIDLIPLRNGVLNLKNMEFSSFTPDKFFLAQLPVEYRPDCECKTFLKFLSEVLEAEDIPIIQELFGYCLQRNYSINKGFMFIGEGRNGKSTLINVLRAFLGGENIASIGLQTLERNRFASSTLQGKLANIYADLPSSSLYETGLFKMLTGNDPVSIEAKFKDHINFLNYAKMIFSCNQLPLSKDTSDALYRRWILLNFPNNFDEDRADINLLEKITTPEELSGILNWAVEGLKRLREQKKFSYKFTIEQIRDQYERLSNSLHAFVKDFYEFDGKTAIPKTKIYAEYQKYCHSRNLPIKSSSCVGRELPQLMGVISERRIIEKKREMCWVGMCEKTESESEDDSPAPSSPTPEEAMNELTRFVEDLGVEVKKSDDL